MNLLLQILIFKAIHRNVMLFLVIKTVLLFQSLRAKIYTISVHCMCLIRLGTVNTTGFMGKHMDVTNHVTNARGTLMK